jgi:ABC-type lipoprotein export system ATPase subunit
MKISPVVRKKIITTHTSYDVDLTFENNITFINGDSGVGKSALFSFIQEMTTEDKEIRCFNYLDKNKNYKSAIKLSKGKLFVIDNADLLLDNKMRQYIATDTENQYVIIGRNPEGLMLDQDEIYEIVSLREGERTKFSLIKSFE